MMFSVVLSVLFLTQQGLCKSKSGDSSSNTLQNKNYPLLLRIVKEGGHRGLQECQRQFKKEIWNCSLVNKNVFQQLPIFVKTTLPQATRETAFLHAISSAAITHEITLQCARNRIPGCRCGKTRKQLQGDREWEWGGCSDNTKYGEKETRRFIDRLEKGNDARTAFNLHNNQVGRKKELPKKVGPDGQRVIVICLKQVVRGSLKKECKCHGVTGSCNLKTCWKQLAPFAVVGSVLKQKYLTAVPVSFKKNKLHEKEGRDRPLSRKSKKLVYLDSSPDYCVRNTTAGSLGMLGRTCTRDAGHTEECRSLCQSCNLRAQTKEHYKQIKCRCKFVWCCTVKCELCTVKYSLTTCSK
ncbi:protein Wnt-8b-like [Porites lutea]|uniref:protein Wnt-8b-like n=1 Tax=Porites lutea TaxID=51062 RepID=UPI003CC6BFA6